MKLSSKLDDHDAQFEQIKDQVLTYDLLEDNAPKIIISNIKNTTNQRHKLQLLKKDQRYEVKEIDWKGINKNIKKIANSFGKIIPLGSAIFRSNFQCGNISSVILAGPNVFQIELEKETNSNRVSNWFYFTVEGVKGEAQFVIKGFTKSSSLYNEGMKICYREAGESSKWRRGGTKISYTNSIEQDEYKTTYELRFSFFFKSNERTCIEFACCFPYNLKKLYNLITQLKYTTYAPLCKSFNGLDVPLLTIGNPDSKEVIVISARVHPGETVSSFIVEGFLKELVGEGQFGKLLRQNILFKVVPMLNPDGVIKGNYRFSGYGCDLNRKWKTCKESGQPEIYYMRQLIKNCNKDRKVIMYIDIHGHSRKKNVFFYGCNQNNNLINSKPIQFPYLMQKISEAYKFQDCSFNVQKDKEGTARITMWRELKIDYVYTLESSFCGPEYGPNYLESDYQKVGKKLCEGIAVFFHESFAKQEGESSKTIQKLVKLKQKALAELNEHPQFLEKKNEDQVGSESEPDTGEIAEKDRNPDTGLPKPEIMNRSPKKANKTKKLFLPSPSNSFNLSSFHEDKPVLYSENSRRDELNTKKTEIRTDIEEINQKSNISLMPNPQPPEIQGELGDFLNLVEMPSNQSSEMHQQRNIRVYSLTRNIDKNGNRVPKDTTISSIQMQPLSEEQCQQTSSQLRASLLHGREGAQYRRVRKMAEQSYRKEVSSEVVQQLQGNQLYISRLDRSAGKHAIAPRFYPTSQQKSRRASVEIYLRRNAREEVRNMNRKQMNFRCMGTEIAKYRSDR